MTSLSLKCTVYNPNRAKCVPGTSGGDKVPKGPLAQLQPTSEKTHGPTREILWIKRFVGAIPCALHNSQLQKGIWGQGVLAGSHFFVDKGELVGH